MWIKKQHKTKKCYEKIIKRKERRKRTNDIIRTVDIDADKRKLVKMTEMNVPGKIVKGSRRIIMETKATVKKASKAAVICYGLGDFGFTVYLTFERFVSDDFLHRCSWVCTGSCFGNYVDRKSMGCGK